MFERHKQKALVKAIIKKIPFVKYLRSYRTRGSDDALYCYSVWMRHLIKYRTCRKDHPAVVAELGPGDSIGVVLAALISGAERIYALDVKYNYNPALNLQIFDQLVDLFQQKSSIPGPEKYPNVIPHLEDYNFPSDIIRDEDLVKLLAPERIQSIREAIIALNDQSGHTSMIMYQAPWNHQQNIDINSVDMILSQAVMEHVLDIHSCYEVMDQWLKPGGVMSHSIDFRCHDTSTVWNGHWFYNPWEWKLVEDEEGPAINRTSYLEHSNKVKRMGYEIIQEIVSERGDGFSYKDYVEKFPNTTREESEITSESIYLLARKISNEQRILNR